MMEVVHLSITEQQAKEAGTMNSTTRFVGLDVLKGALQSPLGLLGKEGCGRSLGSLALLARFDSLYEDV